MSRSRIHRDEASLTEALDLSRVVVVGTSGSGKTIFAAALARALGSPHLDLDAFFWKPNWVARAGEEFWELLAPHLAQPRWVADGNHAEGKGPLWERATVAIWLRYSLAVVLARAVRRTAVRVATRERIHGGNVETFRGGFLSAEGVPWWALRTHGRRARQYTAPALRAAVPFVELRSPAESDRFLGRVQPLTGRTSEALR